MTKKIWIATLALLLGVLFYVPAAQAQAPDCAVQGVFTATGRQGGSAATPTTGYNNKATGCYAWWLNITVTGFSGATVALQDAADASGVASSWENFAGMVVSGSNPSTSTTQTAINFTGFYPWLSVYASSLTGTGTVTYTLYGWKGAPAGGATTISGTVNVDVVGNTIGLATAANQTTSNTNTSATAVSVASIDTKATTGNSNTGAIATSVASMDTKLTTTNTNTGATTTNTGAIATSIGATTVDKCITYDTTACTVEGLLKGWIYYAQTPTGQQTMANSNSVTLASNQSTITVTGAVTNAGTFATQPASATAPVQSMNSSTANAGLNSAMACVYDDTSPTSITENNFGFVRCGPTREVYVTPTPGTTTGWSSLNATAADGATACTNSAQAVKASQGTFGGYFINNPNTADEWLHVYNVASGSVTVGTTNPQLTFRIPGQAANSVGANLEISLGVQFSTAMAIACTSTAGGNGAPSNALEADIFYK